MNYKELKEQLIKYSDSYYKNSKSEISDYEFDMKMKELEKMEFEQGFADPDSPTQKPGSDLILEIKEENKHRRPMLSLENTYNTEELADWFFKMQEATGKKNPEIVIERKVDGGSAAIHFKNGKVVKALTRGSGTHGESITQNVQLLDFSKVSSDFTGEIRGELVITKSGFEILNKEGKYQNARNLLSGSMKLLDPKEFSLRAPYIKFIAYWNEDDDSKTHYESLKTLHDAGFVDSLYSSSVKVDNFEDLKKEIEKIQNEKSSYEYDIDGAVLKLNDKTLWEKIGSTSKFPRWARAYKYEQEKVETTVTKIEYGVGMSGKITPLCWFEPVFIDGSTIQKATLNNKDFMSKMNIGIGDKILVQKAACIIPQIIEVIDRSGRKYGKETFPTHCPVCGTKLKKLDESQADYYCLNDNCPERIVDRIVNFAQSMEIDGFGEVIVSRIHDAGYINKLEDILLLGSKETKWRVSLLDRLSTKIIDKMLDNINNAKGNDPWKFLAGLGIRNVGAKTAKILMKKFKDIRIIMSASVDELREIQDVGPIVAQSIVDFFKNPVNKKTVKAFEDAGFKMATDEPKEMDELVFEGKSFVITGALSKPRSHYQKIIETLGGKLIGSVSSKTSFLLTNDKNSGSTKNREAKRLGIPVIDEKDFFDMCASAQVLNIMESL